MFLQPTPQAQYPRPIRHANNYIRLFEERAHGCFFLRRKGGRSARLLVVSGGMHGDERAGTEIVESLLEDLQSGKIPLATDAVLLFGNIKAIFANNGKGVRNLSEGCGHLDNLNRCFGKKHETPQCYSQRRANEIMDVMEAIAPAYRDVVAIDIHQSFAVPTVQEVRSNSTNRTEYTYAMGYPTKQRDADEVLRWFYHEFSDIVAGVVMYPRDHTSSTFASYMARRFNALAATFEQGTIGYTDEVTFTPQLRKNLARKLAGIDTLEEPEGFDVWEKQRDIIKGSEAFTFLNEYGEPTDRPPRDFVYFPHAVFAVDDAAEYEKKHPAERLLFANARVPVGDRAACVIAPAKNNAGIPIPTGW